MFNKISIIGCGLIGSSILRAVEEKKLASNISIFDRSSKVIFQLKFALTFQMLLRTPI